MRRALLAGWFFWSVACLAEAAEAPLQADAAAASRAEATRRRVEELYRSLPLGDQPIIYVTVGDKLVPGQVEPNTNIEYRWSGVALDPSQVPGLDAGGSFGIMPMPPTGLPVRETAPPLRFMKIADTLRFRVGYYDKLHEIVYKWNGVELTAAELPPNAVMISAAGVTISTVKAPDNSSQVVRNAASAPGVPPATRRGSERQNAVSFREHVPDPPPASTIPVRHWKLIISLCALLAILVTTWGLKYRPGSH